MNLRARAIAARNTELRQMLSWREGDPSERRRIVCRERDALEALPVDVADAAVVAVLAEIDREESEAFAAAELARAEALAAYYARAR